MIANWMVVLNTVLGNVKREEGQGLAEYALIIVLVAIAVVGALGALGSEMTSVFSTIVSKLGVTS